MDDDLRSDVTPHAPSSAQKQLGFAMLLIKIFGIN